MDRNKKAREVVASKVTDSDRRMRMMQLENFVVNKLNGNFFLARYNQVLSQLTSGIILESIDGNIKSKDYILYECLLAKHRATKCFAHMWVANKELLLKGLTQQQIYAYYNKYVGESILRDDYSDIVEQDDNMPRFV